MADSPARSHTSPARIAERRAVEVATGEIFCKTGNHHTASDGHVVLRDSKGRQYKACASCAARRARHMGAK